MKHEFKNDIIVSNNLKVRRLVKNSAKNIERKLSGIKVNSFKCVDSTNNVAKTLAENGCEEGELVIAERQTAGKGRLGRSFLSQKGGIYLSLVLKPTIPPQDTLFITTAAAVAVCRAIESVSGKKCDIKWVNDVYISGKKVCGILTEGAFNADGSLKYAILGVGINLFCPKHNFPENLPLADSVFHKKDGKIFKNRIKKQVIAEFVNVFMSFYKDLQQKDFMAEYQMRSLLTGKEITYEKDGEKFAATVIGIDNDAHLVIERDGKREFLSQGEIQIVGMEQLSV